MNSVTTIYKIDEIYVYKNAMQHVIVDSDTSIIYAP